MTMKLAVKFRAPDVTIFFLLYPGDWNERDRRKVRETSSSSPFEPGRLDLDGI
jgi:hypothetical protein